MRILRDEELRPILDLPAVVARLERGFRLEGRGGVVPFPRRRYDVAGTTVAWLGAALPSEDILGYRSYLSRADGEDRGHQVVALYGQAGMELRALFPGRLVGNLRTGATLAAVFHLLEPELTELGLIGTGYQARNALTCLASLYRPLRVRAWSPDAARREAFRAWAERLVGVHVELAPNAGEVLRTARSVVLATSAEEPVVRRESITEPTLLVSLSAYRRPEIDPSLLDAAPQVWTDSVVQAGGPGTLFEREDRRSKLRSLGAGLEDGSVRERARTRIVLNTGAAWEEVLVAQMLLELAESRGIGTNLTLPEHRPPDAVF